jgi:hypothetical protein
VILKLFLHIQKKYQDKRKSKGQFSRNDSLTHEDHEMLVIAEKES